MPQSQDREGCHGLKAPYDSSKQENIPELTDRTISRFVRQTPLSVL